MAYEEARATDHETCLAALADPTRRSIFERLRSGELAVGALAKELPVSRPAVSQHLKVLESAGLVVARQEGTRRLYCIDPRGLEPLRRYLDGFWGDVLSAFSDAAETAPEPGKPSPPSETKTSGDPP